MLVNDHPPVMDRINSVIARFKLRYLSFTDVTGFRRPMPTFLIGTVLRVPTMGERFFEIPKKR